MLSHAAVSSAEWDRATEVLAVAKLGAHAVPGWVDFASMQLTAYSWLSGAFDRYPDPVLAGREAALVVMIATSLVVLALCRRLRLGWPSGVVAALGSGVGLYAAGLAPTVSAGIPAALWLTLCCLTASRPRARIDEVVLASIAGVIAILTAPIVAAVALAGLSHAAASGGIGVRWSPGVRRLTSAGAALGAAAVIAGVVWLEGNPTRPLNFDWSTGRWAVWAAVTVTVAAAAVTARWLRTAAWAMVTLVAAAFLNGPAGVDALLVAVPPAAVLAAAALAELRTDHATSAAISARLAAATRWVGLVLVAGATTTMVIGAASASSGAEPHGSAAQVSEWLERNTPESATVLVSSRQWAQLVAAGTPSNRLLSVDGLGSADAPTPADLTQIDYVVRPTTGDQSWADLAEPLDQRSLPLAMLGSGDDEVTVSAIVPDGAAATEALTAGTSERAALGVALAGSPRLDLTPEADAVLRAGDVDGRLLSVLPLILADHSLSITAFEHAAGEEGTGAPARTALISFLDGRPIPADPTAVAALTEIFHAQQSVFRPLDVASVTGGLRVVYAAPSPPGLPTG